jgi:hypothetical protein
MNGRDKSLQEKDDDGISTHIAYDIIINNR